MKSVLFVVVLCSLVIAPAWAQSGASISGFVRDATSGETLLLANVRLKGTAIGAATNTAGYYTIPGLAHGTYTVIASYIGYQASTREVVLQPGEALRLDIELVPESVQIGEVVVTDERGEEERRALGVEEMSTQAVKELPTVFEPDLFRSLQLLPGVKAASDYSSGLYIRGGGPDQTLILLDRNTVYNPSHFFGFFSPFNPDAIKDVRLYKGGYPAQYGGRLGSVLDVYNKDGNRRAYTGGVSLGLLATRAYVEGPYAKGSWMLAMRRSTIDPLLAVLREADVDGIPDLFYFYDVNGKVNLDATKDDLLSLSVYVGKDRLDVPFLEDASISVALGNRTLSGNWTHIFSERLFSNFTVSASRYFSNPDFHVAGTAFRRRNYVHDVAAKGQFEYIPNKRHALKGGFWAGNFTMRLRDAFDEQDGLRSHIRTLYASVYGEETFRPNSLLQITGGVRANFFERGDYVRLEPRLSAEYRPNANLRLQVGYGRYYQFLTLITSELLSAFDVWLTTAEDVPPAYGDQYLFGVKSLLGGGLNVDVEVYFRSMEDLFQINPLLPDVAGKDYDEIFHYGDGLAYGSELQLEKTTGRLRGFIGYTLGRTVRRFPPHLNLGRYYPPKYDRTHDLSAVGSYELGRGWRFTSVFTYATGQAYTEPSGTYKLQDNPLTRRLATPLVAADFNNRRLPPYHRLDLGFSKMGRLFGVADYELQLQVINAYNRRNVWFYVFDVELDNTITRTEVPQIPVPIPNVSLTLTF